MRGWLRRCRECWTGLGSPERIALVFIVLSFLAVVVVVSSRAIAAMPGPVQANDADIQRLCAKECVVLSREQYDAISAYMRRCGWL